MRHNNGRIVIQVFRVLYLQYSQAEHVQMTRLIYECFILLGNQDENNINIEHYIPLSGKIIYFNLIFIFCLFEEGFICRNKIQNLHRVESHAM